MKEYTIEKSRKDGLYYLATDHDFYRCDPVTGKILTFKTRKEAKEYLEKI